MSNKERVTHSRPTSDSCIPMLSPSSFHALVIGINKYAHHDVKDLNGCVADVDDIVRFLEYDLSIPKGNIVKLVDEGATRQNIIQSFENLAKLSRHSAILIYYAGHGAPAKLPNSEEKIEMLLPYDFIPKTNDVEDAQGIPDIKLRELLTKVADAIGNNITVILDSCYSGSGTRNGEAIAEFSTPRCIDLPSDYTVSSLVLPKDISRKGYVAKDHENDGLVSHVLLAACSRDGEAREIYQRGQFTKALMNILRDPRYQPNTVSYQDVIRLLPDLPSQVPQCEGRYSDRILFDGKALRCNQRLFPVLFSDGKFTIDAGEVQGVTNGACFDIYSAPSIHSEKIASMVAENTFAYSTILNWPSGNPERPLIPPPAWAFKTRAGKDEDVLVALTFESESPRVFKQIVEKLDHKPGKKAIPINSLDPSIAKLKVAKEGENAIFQLTDSICCRNKLERLPHGVDFNAETIYSILNHSADFFWALQHSRKPTKGGPEILRLQKYINIEAWELKTEYDTHSKVFVLTPTGKDLNVGSEIQIPIENSEVRYGFKITSKFDRPLYVWVFNFNMSDLSVDIVYKPNVAKKADPCLEAHGTLTIGFGTGGWPPQSFYLPPGIDADVSYLKVFIATQYVDLSDIERKSPFEKGTGRKGGPNPLKISDWDTILVPIIQKKAA